jgi:hypothetical protein
MLFSPDHPRPSRRGNARPLNSGGTWCYTGEKAESFRVTLQTQDNGTWSWEIDDTADEETLEVAEALKEGGLILNLKSNSADILRWDMGVMFARSYVLQLSDNVKRSKEEALKKGICIGRAPLGYKRILNEKGEKAIIPDAETKAFVQHMFSEYASEVEEKKQLLNFVVQNLILEGGKLVYTLREPFSMIMRARECPSGWGQLDSNQRSRETRDLQVPVYYKFETNWMNKDETGKSIYTRNSYLNSSSSISSSTSNYGRIYGKFN